MITAVVMALGGIGLAWWLFGADPQRRIRLARVAAGPRGVMRDAWRFDEAYDDIVVDPGRELADVMINKVEPDGPQGIITGTTALVRAYVFWMVLGIAVAGIILALVVAGAS
jgi:hypothetical protein